MSQQRTVFRLAASLGALGVIIGAFGAHGLKSYVAQTFGPERGPELMAIYETGVFYHLIHAVAMLALSVAGEQLGLWSETSTRKTARVAWLWAAGVMLFSGSLYLLAATNLKWLGAITPFGGLAFIAGWVLLLFAAKPSPAKPPA